MATIKTTTSQNCPICKGKLQLDESLISVRANSDWNMLHAKCNRCEIGYSNSQKTKDRKFIWKKIEKNMIFPNANNIDLMKKTIVNSMNVGNQDSKLKGMKHENSEDALTWNIFRTLEEKNLIGKAYSYFSGISDSGNHDECIVYYWGYNDQEPSFLEKYTKVLKKAGEPKWRGGYSEPDVLLYNPNHGLINIEVKFKSPNDDKLGKNMRSDTWKRRCKRAQTMLDLDKNGEFVIEKSANKWIWYELLRMWIPGCMLAKDLDDINFYLVNLLPQEMLIQEKGKVSYDMSQLIKSDKKHQFSQITWEAFAYEMSTWNVPFDTTFWKYLNRKLKGELTYYQNPEYSKIENPKDTVLIRNLNYPQI